MTYESTRQPAETGFLYPENDAAQAPEGTQAGTTHVNYTTHAEPLDFERIPTELKALTHWVCWKFEQKPDRPELAKVPKNARTGRNASTVNPSDWCNFETAVTAYQRGDYSGLGFVFTRESRIVGIDLDECIDPDTGELLAWAQEIVAELGTYIEVSPSGKGLHAYGLGTIPQAKRKGSHASSAIEIYDHGRYFAVTGWQFTTTSAVTEQQAALTRIYRRAFGNGEDKTAKAKPDYTTRPDLDMDDSTLIEKALAASNGGKFRALWNGDISGHGGDDSAADLALCSHLAFWTGKDAARMDRLFRQSGLMRSKWNERRGDTTYGAMTIAKAISECREIYTGGGTRGNGHDTEPPDPAPTTADEAVKDAPTTIDLLAGLDLYRATDLANAELFLALSGKDIRYIPSWSKWLLWTGSHWRLDEIMKVHRLAVGVARTLYRRAADTEEVDARRKIAALAKSLENERRRAAMVASAAPHVVIHHSELDRGHFLLNVSNGTVDLRTGKLRPHERTDLLTHDTGIPYLPDAVAPTWLGFLNDIFRGDAALTQFMQRAFGYSLTGSVKEQILFVCHGIGSNGKGKLLNMLRKLLGTLAAPAPSALLMASKTERHPTELAALFGKRAVISQETNQGQRFNESLVKSLTGGDAISARRMREDFWEFEPTHKLWLATNHKPVIKGTDYAIWRRIRLIPFNVVFTDESTPRKDPDIEDKLTAELPGILAWAIRGCLDWQREGLGMADAIKVATASYQAEMDVLAAFLADCCVTDRNARVKAGDLYAAYCDWCKQTGERAETLTRFGQRVIERGFEKCRLRTGWHYKGIGLQATGYEEGEL